MDTEDKHCEFCYFQLTCWLTSYDKGKILFLLVSAIFPSCRSVPWRLPNHQNRYIPIINFIIVLIRKFFFFDCEIYVTLLSFPVVLISNGEWESKPIYIHTRKKRPTHILHSGVSICANITTWAHPLLASCLAWFKADKWIAVFSILVIDSKTPQSNINIFIDDVSSNAAASYMGCLGAI